MYYLFTAFCETTLSQTRDSNQCPSESSGFSTSHRDNRQIERLRFIDPYPLLQHSHIQRRNRFIKRQRQVLFRALFKMRTK